MNYQVEFGLVIEVEADSPEKALELARTVANQQVKQTAACWLDTSDGDVVEDD